MCIYIVALEKQTISYQKVGKLVEKTGELGRLTSYNLHTSKSKSVFQQVNKQPTKYCKSVENKLHSFT